MTKTQNSGTRITAKSRTTQLKTTSNLTISKELEQNSGQKIKVARLL